MPVLLRIFLLLVFPTLLSAQVVTGIVLDENGEGLPYATVYLRNSTRGTTTNAVGEFRLPVEKPGTYELVFQYIGYKQKIEPVTVTAAKAARVRITMEPNNLEINEVTITTEDPAVRIMREAIAKRKYYKKRLGDYSCEVYVKGFTKLVDAPKKIMGIEVGDMGGVLDTNRTGVMYLSESVSRLYVQTSPERIKEVIVSSRVSGDPQGFTFNRATLTSLSFYDEHANIGRDLLSPLASNAFDYYRFKLKGKYRDKLGFNVYKIEVVPRRSDDPVYGGHVYIVDDHYNLAGVDLFITGATIKQPIVDTLRIRQQFVPVDMPDGWALLSQVLTYQVDVFGFKAKGFFNCVSSNYDFKPDLASVFDERETFRMDTDAPKRDTAYWESVRPVPLTSEEQLDYTRKDSIYRVTSSKAYLDSMDRRANRFRPMNLINGYTWRNSYRHTRVEYPAAAKWIQFNTVQGWLVNIEPSYRRDADEFATSTWRVDGTLNYGFSEKRLRPSARVVRRFESIQYRTLDVQGGVATEQFNPRQPIGVLVNGLYSLWGERNYLKLFEKTYGAVNWSQRRPGLLWFAGAEFAERRPLVNTSTYSFRKDGRPSRYTPNAPDTTLQPAEPFFSTHRALTLSVDLRFRLGETYNSYPKFRTFNGSNWPDLWLRYRKAIPGVAGSVIDYDLLQVQLMQEQQPFGLLGYTEWNVLVGKFLNRRRLEYMDRFQPRGNETFIAQPGQYHRSFMLLPFYGYGTDGAFVDAHVQHHWQGWLLDKLPLIRKLKLKEVLGFGFYYADLPPGEGIPSRQLPYWEVNFGLENIGFNFFRPLRIDVVSGFFGNEYYRTGVVVGVSL